MAESEDKFQVTVDVQDYSPEEVKVDNDGRFLTIVGQHEELLQNHGYISRHFIRRFLLPSNVEIAALESTINDGILTVTAPAAILPTQSKKTEMEEYVKHTEKEVHVENPEGSVSRNTEGKENIEHKEENARAKTLAGPTSGKTEGGQNSKAEEEKPDKAKINESKPDKE